ncbi:LLM class flavin-dependent oxidoreductase [Rhodopila sp.]|uniref:LLM class flavin-dependent oxidoreductase n=1 Tax=Rhodopila sp. TaxID=2480087 RepID=UPI003D13B4AD
MKFSNFLFPDSASPADDGRIIDETLQEARLTDALGYDTIWLAEHHFDGIVAYVDPVSFAAALATATTRARIGFAVAQMALHHPIRLAEQVALIDHISKGRLIVGLGRGTAYNIYDYQGFGIDHTEAQARFEEAEAIMFEAWKGEPLEHHGEFFDLKLPGLRPAVYTRPHPYVIRAAATEHGMLDIARRGKPFMMNVQNNTVTAQRMQLYRQTLRDIGLNEAAVAARCEECWIWRNVCVAETDAEAQRIAVPAFTNQLERRAEMRNRVYQEQGRSILPMPPADAPPPSHASVENGLVYGSPATVAAKLAPLMNTGVGGLIIQFRLGSMSYEQTVGSLTLFRDKVIPALEALAESRSPCAAAG